MATKRNQHRGIRKICKCARRGWAKCPHSWHFNFKPKGGPAYRFSVDMEAGKHIASKSDAENLAHDWRNQINAGTFRRRAETPTNSEGVSKPDVVTLDMFIEKYIERCAHPVSINDRGCLRKFAAF